MKRGDIVIALFLIVLAAGFFIVQSLTGGADASLAVISENGKEVIRLPLSSDETYVFEAEGGGENVIVIENGEVYIEKASCPDKICVNEGRKSRNGETIVCLPHRLVVECVTGEDAGLDGLAR